MRERIRLIAKTVPAEWGITGHSTWSLRTPAGTASPEGWWRRSRWHQWRSSAAVDVARTAVDRLLDPQADWRWSWCQMAGGVGLVVISYVVGW
ncbi:hypothetical protein [Streptosporangium sp. NPDC000396]|uniref:hypothetical protein n=1 Tax=Streptosporangium sp. NPDC000396 TaxID=3366185 RepID=UPI0036A388E9